MRRTQQTTARHKVIVPGTAQGKRPIYCHIWRMLHPYDVSRAQELANKSKNIYTKHWTSCAQMWCSNETLIRVLIIVFSSENIDFYIFLHFCDESCSPLLKELQNKINLPRSVEIPSSSLRIALTLSSDCTADRARSTATMGCVLSGPCQRATTSLPAIPKCLVSEPTSQWWSYWHLLEKHGKLLYCNFTYTVSLFLQLIHLIKWSKVVRDSHFKK
jgi:hypothetical protein